MARLSMTCLISVLVSFLILSLFYLFQNWLLLSQALCGHHGPSPGPCSSVNSLSSCLMFPLSCSHVSIPAHPQSPPSERVLVRPMVFWSSGPVTFPWGLEGSKQSPQYSENGPSGSCISSQEALVLRNLNFGSPYFQSLLERIM